MKKLTLYPSFWKAMNNVLLDNKITNSDELIDIINKRLRRKEALACL